MYTVTFISNITYEPVIEQVLQEGFCFQRDIHLEFMLPEDIQQKYSVLKKTDIVVLALNFDNWLPDAEILVNSKDYNVVAIKKEVVTRCSLLYKNIKKATYAKVLWFGFEDYFANLREVCGSTYLLRGAIDEINLRLMKKIYKTDSYLDFKALIAKIGINNSFSLVDKYRWNMPYTKELIHCMCEEINKQIKIQNGESPKCIVVDCDNVLWGGILADDGIDGIVLNDSGSGSQYRAFQRFLISLYHHGVILAICSKNNAEDVLKVFREHSSMLLKETHISCFKCNWDDKPKNIEAIASYLNISLHSIVFVDDSFFEINGVTCVLPEVHTILYDKKTIFRNLSCFNVRDNIDINVVEQRTETYKSNIQRELLRNNSVTFDMYLKTLATKIDIHLALSNELSRISELTQRTNKCTNGKRYTIDELRRLANCHEYEIYSICVSDRFSNLGLVGAVILRNEVMDVFSVSCRVLGRGVEEHILDFFKSNKNVYRVDWLHTINNKDFAEKLIEYSYELVDLSN